MKRNNIFALSIFSLFLVIGLTGCEQRGESIPKFTVTFDAGTGGTLTDPATVQVETGETIAKPKDPTREGFSFVEWQKADGTAFIFNSETVTANITLTAQWAQNFTVTFAGEDITTPPQTVTDGSMANEPPTPTRTDYTFVNWQKPDGGGAFDFTTDAITADITLTAQWAQNFTVTFAGEDVTTAAQTVADGSMATPPPTPTRVGFTFVEWRKTGATTAFPFTTETITANITLTAQWAQVQYTATFDLMGGMFASGTATAVQVPHGEKLTAPTPPTKVGSTFAGWQKADGSAFAFTTETITADITLTAQWTLESHPLTQLTDDSSLLRMWMQRATDNAQLPATNRYFTEGTNANNDVASIHIDGATFTIFVNAPTPSSAAAASTQTGIPATVRDTDNAERALDFADLFGTGKTADGYAVNEDTLYIIQNQANAQTRTTLAIMVINSTAKSLFVQAGEAPGLLLHSDRNTNPIAFSYAEWFAKAQLADGAYEGISSTSGDVGVGSTLIFVLRPNKTEIDTLKFTQSNTPANQISDLLTGVIATYNSPKGVSSPQWPNASIIRALYDVTINAAPRNGDLELFTLGPSLATIAIVTPGGNLAVTYLPARNSDNPATEVTVTYRRPSSN